MEIKNIETQLQQVEVRVSHSKELAKLNGENFNIFTLLGMESNENKTHSRFLAELLNPKGSHNMGNTFLKIAMCCVLSNIDNFDTKTAVVTIEKNIGKTDFENKTGGRIDIAISDANGYNIFIENKIFAGDQPVQIERYCSCEKEKSRVYYLTLDGKEPSKESKGNLVSGLDYTCISYKDDILNWLEFCIKEAAEQPILRETIKSYIILIKKLTGQLTNDKMKKEIEQLILKNLESAQAIVTNFQNAKNKFFDEIRNGVTDQLKSKLDSKYEIPEDSNVGVKNSKIWLYPLAYKDLGIPFGIEPFSGIGYSGSKLFIGIIAIEEKNRNFFNSKYPDLKKEGWWYRKEHFEKFEGFDIDFSNLEFIQFLENLPEKKKLLIAELSGQIVEYIRLNEPLLNQICEEVKNNEAITKTN